MFSEEHLMALLNDSLQITQKTTVSQAIPQPVKEQAAAQIAVTPEYTNKLNPPSGFTGPIPDFKAPTKDIGGAIQTTPGGQKNNGTIFGTGFTVESFFEALFGKETGANIWQSVLEEVATKTGVSLENLTRIINSPEFNQGFANLPKFVSVSTDSNPSYAGSIGTSSGGSSALGAVATAGGKSPISSNPMDVFQNNGISGLLGTSASAGVKTLEDFNKASLIAIDYDPQETQFVKDFANDVMVAATGLGAAAGVAALAGVSAPLLLAAGAVLGGYGAYAHAVVRLTETYGTPVEGTATGSAIKIPDPEMQGKIVNIISEAILDQLAQVNLGKPVGQGGSGDAMPVDDGGIGGVVQGRAIAINSQSQLGKNLFGQPVGLGGENVSGGNKGLDTFGNSNGAGVINPGDGGSNPAGDSRFLNDPGQAIGGAQPAPNLSGAPTQSGQTLTGTAGNDVLIGSTNNDLLDGRQGRDILTGGSGSDRFRFTIPEFGLNQADRITDFNRLAGDRLEISRAAFDLAANTVLSFQTVNSDSALAQALGSNNLFVYDQRNGSLFFNQNGAAAGFGEGGVFAVLEGGAALTASDITFLG
ncbi:calcium-binding protein [Synechococcus elongatus IITB7]|uniref:calcium-binding protein n=1 Tax=Synechococcus elongatus TaxID=32046 RepID=UPI0030CDCD6B